MANQGEEKQVLLYLMGPFLLSSDRGDLHTPTGQKTQALIALLAVAPRGRRSRAWLKDKLWSDRSPPQASASLRQALHEAKKALSKLSCDILTADKQNISLNLESVWIDIHHPESFLESGDQDPQAHQFLEGIDIQDPEFEDWLTNERRVWTTKMEEFMAQESGRRKTGSSNDASTERGAETSGRTAASAAGAGSSTSQHIAIGLLPPIVPNQSPELTTLADLIVESVARNLGEVHPIDIYDYRDTGMEAFGVPIGTGPDLVLRIRVKSAGSDLYLSLLAYNVANQKLIWSYTIHADQEDALQFDTLTISGFINQNVDRLANSFFTHSLDTFSKLPSNYKTGYTALNYIFRLDEKYLTAAESLLTESYDNDPQSNYLGLLAYISSFNIGENLGEFTDAKRLATIGHASEALEVDPFNSITLACIGHVHGFVFRDFETAADLHAQAVELNPHQAFAWDHFALFNIYTGRYQEALKAAHRACYLGSFSPLRYSFDTTVCMAATLCGEYPTAVRYGNRALSRQPRFGAAMRYLIASHGHLGNVAEAQQHISRLRTISPDFDLPFVRENGLAIAENEGLQRMIEGYEKAGL
ncbi:hypothetical protein FMN50_22525 [Rhodobacterales bacterium]|nr:hypothetical protein FMN50_22525 [Rhodobacterales bacterium]